MKLKQFTLIIALLIVGFISGNISSTFTLMFLDSSAKASKLSYELRQLREGKTAEYIKTKETELDVAIYNHVRYRNGIYPILAWPVSMQYEHSKYIKTVLEYRREFPQFKNSQDKDITKEQKLFWEEHEEDLEYKMQLLKTWYGSAGKSG